MGWAPSAARYGSSNRGELSGTGSASRRAHRRRSASRCQHQRDRRRCRNPPRASRSSGCPYSAPRALAGPRPQAAGHAMRLAATLCPTAACHLTRAGMVDRHWPIFRVVQLLGRDQTSATTLSSATARYSAVPPIRVSAMSPMTVLQCLRLFSVTVCGVAPPDRRRPVGRWPSVALLRLRRSAPPHPVGCDHAPLPRRDPRRLRAAGKPRSRPAV